MNNIIALLNIFGYNIKTREYTKTNGSKLIYITEINGVKYKTNEQVKAHNDLNEIVKEVISWHQFKD